MKCKCALCAGRCEGIAEGNGVLCHSCAADPNAHPRGPGHSPPTPEDREEYNFHRELIASLRCVTAALLKQEATAREMLEFMKERYPKHEKVVQ